MAKKESKTEPVEQQKYFMNLLRDYWQTYCEKSTIHCVRYLYDPNLHNIERVIWCALLIACVTFTCIFYLLLAERYNAQKVETIVEDPQYPVFYLPFPAVGVCPDNRINWSMFEAAKAKFLPANATQEVIEVFTTVVSRMEVMRFGNFNPAFANLDDVHLESLQFLNLSALALYMALSCEDIFQQDSCSWRGMHFRCCEHFFMEITEYGYCLVFNSVLSDESQNLKKLEGYQYYPKHNSKAGQSTGLNFHLKLYDKFKRPNSTATDNVFLMLKKAEQLSNNVFTVISNTQTYITVRPEVTTTHESTRKLPPEVRNCMFPDEQQPLIAYKRFTRSFLLTNCLSICHAKYLEELCNCSIPIFFFNTYKFIDCNTAHLPCLARHNDIFSYDKRQEEDAYFSTAKPGMTCYCLVNCNSVEYFASMTTLPLNAFYMPKNRSEHVFAVDVHYQTEMIVKYRTNLEFTSIDLIASFGGIFGLCLGASMVSAVELIYYGTIGFALFLYDKNYYAVFINTLKERWQIWSRYLRNEVHTTTKSNNTQGPEYALQHAIKDNKGRHPFNHKQNLW